MIQVVVKLSTKRETRATSLFQVYFSVMNSTDMVLNGGIQVLSHL